MVDFGEVFCGIEVGLEIRNSVLPIEHFCMCWKWYFFVGEYFSKFGLKFSIKGLGALGCFDLVPKVRIFVVCI